jgi:hypothetical protein
MRQRADPLVPILGSAVALLFVFTVGFIFYPRVAHWIQVRASPALERNGDRERSVPVWLCRSEQGVALILQPAPDVDAARGLDAALAPGGRHHLVLSVYNFARPDAYSFDPKGGLDAEGGAARARPVAGLVRPDAPEHLRAVLRGLGAVEAVTVEPGHCGKLLLAVEGDPSATAAFVGGTLRFERREVRRRTLAKWESSPHLEGFLDF